MVGENEQDLLNSNKFFKRVYPFLISLINWQNCLISWAYDFNFIRNIKICIFFFRLQNEAIHYGIAIYKDQDKDVYLQFVKDI